MNRAIEGIEVISDKAGILVVDKPPGLLSQPGLGPAQIDSVLTRLRKVFPSIALVHRLDRDTSGLLMLALNPSVHRAMSMLFEARMVRKTYMGLCTGQLWGISGTIVSPLARLATHPPEYGPDREGKIAITHWQNLGIASSRTRLRLFPITGRSHQLRAHLKGIGHPLIGDPIYGQSDGNRLMLHAETLEFQHPETGEWEALCLPSPF